MLFHSQRLDGLRVIGSAFLLAMLVRGNWPANCIRGSAELASSSAFAVAFRYLKVIIACVRLRASLTVLLAGAALTLHGQVRELWRSGLTNGSEPFQPRTNYSVTTATVDAHGNTIVGGVAKVSYPIYITRGVIAEFDSHGVKKWEYCIGTNVQYGIEGLVTDSHGNVFFTLRADPYHEPVAALVKLSPNGGELWRVAETNVINGPPNSFPTTVKLDSHGCPFFYVAVFRKVPPGVLASEQVVSHFDGDGVALWRAALPGQGYIFGDAGLLKAIEVASDGGVIVVGGYYGNTFPVNGHDPVDSVGFAAKLDAEGRLLWWSDGFKGKDKPSL